MLFLPNQNNQNMLSSIEIENFRAFQKLKVKGFKAVNLIGGQNNSGKTALLEALFLLFMPHGSTLTTIMTFRGEEVKVNPYYFKRIWDFIFHNQNINKLTKIYSNFENGKNSSVEFSCPVTVEAVAKILTENIVNQNVPDIIYSNFQFPSFLNIKGNSDNEKFDFLIFPNKENGHTLMVGVLPKQLEESPFVHTRFAANNLTLASMYSLAKEDRKVEYLNRILKLVDSRIESSEIVAPGGEPFIKLNLKDGKSFSVNMFGDAIKRISEIVLVMLSSSQKVLFIDEIENGIHFTKHKFLWKILFEISKSTGCQIFATSHSSEMIKSFCQAAVEEKFEEHVSYFEMSRLPDDEIIANKMDMEMLNYEILTNSSYRGE